MEMHNIPSTTVLKHKLQATSRNDSMSDISLPPFGSQNSSFSSISNTSQTISNSKLDQKLAKQKSGTGLKQMQGESEDSNRITNGKTTYQMGAEIGRGGFAIVYSAFNVETGDFVAVKRFPLDAIDGDSLNKIQDEIELMKQLNHPNIVKYINTIKSKSHLHIVLEYMENGSLSTVIKKYGSISESLTASYVTQVLNGLNYLHDQGVLHRDIKGANILTTKEGTVKLADFGVAMKLSDAHADDQDVVGSPYWIAPEIIEMSTPTAACDIWSVGCIIIELLTGKPPYYDLAPMAALFRIVQDDYPPFPEGISQALRDFLLLCFQKEPVMRSSAAKLLEHPWLSNFSKGSNVSNKRNQVNEDEDSGSAQNESVDKSLDSFNFNSPLYRSRSTNLTSRSSISSAAKAASLSTSSELAAASSASHSKSSSPRNRKGPGHNRSGGKKRDALKAFHGVNIPAENESFGATSTHTEVDHLSAFYADDITLDPYAKQPKPPIVYSTISDRTPSSSYRTSDDSVNRKMSLSRQSSPALSDSTTDTKDMMLPAPGMMHVSMNSGFTTDIALGQLHINSGASSLSTPTSISNPPSKVNSHDQMEDSSSVRFQSSDSIQGIRSRTDKDKDLAAEVANNLHSDEDSCDDDDESDDWAVAEEFVCDDRSSILSTGDASLAPHQSISSKSMNTRSNLENTSINSKAEQLSASKKKFYSTEKSWSRSAGLLANLIDLSFTSNTASTSRDLVELTMNNKPILNVNNSSFLLSKYQETADDNNFDDVFDGSRTDSHSRDMSSQKIISGLSKSSDYTYKQKDEHILRSKSSDCYESSSSPQNIRPLHRNHIKKPKAAIAVAVSSYSSDRSSAMNDVFPVVQSRWNDLESSQSTDLFSSKKQDSQSVLIKLPFKRLGMISEDKDSTDYDFNNDFEIDPSIDFNERLERYRSNAVAGSSSSSGISGNHSSSSRDRGKGIYNPKRFDITSFSTTSAADIDYDSDENDGDKFAGKLRERLQSRKDAEFDNFNNYQFFDEKDFKQDESKDEHFRRSREVVEIMEKIRPDTMEETVIDLCNKLLDLFSRYPDQRDHLITYHGVMPIIDMFEARTSAESKSQGGKILRPYVLRVINKIIEGSTRAQEQISLVGLIPTIMSLFEKSCRVQEQQSNFLSMSYSVYGSNSVDRMNVGSQDFTPNKYSSSVIQSPYAQWQGEVNPVAIEAARFIHQISSTSQLTLQMLIGAGGLSVLTTMVSFGAYIVPKGLVSAPVSVTHSLSHSRSSSHSHLLSHSLSPPTQNLTPNATTYQGTLSLGFGAENEGIAAVHRTSYNLTNLTTSLKFSRSPHNNAYSMRYDPRLVRSFSPSGAVDLDLYNSSNESHSVIAGADILDASGPTQNPQDTDNNSRQVVAAGDPKNCLDIFRMGIDCITQVFSVQSSRTRDFCRLFVKLGLLQHLSVSFQNILFLFLTLVNKRAHLRSYSGSSAINLLNLASESGASQNEGSSSTKVDPIEQVYAKSVATLFFKFSRSDAVVAQIMANSEAGVITTILEALSAPELRNQVSPIGGPHPASPSTQQQQQQQQFAVKANSNTDNNNSSNNNNNSKIRHAANIGGLHPAYLEIVELLLKCCKNLSMEPSILNDLDKAGIIETLIPLLQGPISELCKNHVLPCLFNMCRINKKRQEKAAQLGLIPHLKKVVADRSHLKQFALPIIFDLAHASASTRTELWKNDGVAFYLDQLKENYWHTSALNSLSTWLARDMVSVSRLLIEPAKLSKLIDFFRSSNATVHKNLKPIVDIMKSPEVSQSLGSSSVFVGALSKRLTATKDAFISRSLLRMLDSIIRSLPDPKLWIAQHNLYHVLSEVSQTDQILVNKMSKDLLHDLQSLFLQPPKQQHHQHRQT